MSDSQSAGDPATASSGENYSTLFAHLVMQQSNMAMMLLGKVAHPETGQVITDTDAARLFIDQLEMLEVKTKGNLTKEESGLLKQSLMALRMAYVEAVNAPPQSSTTTAKPETQQPAQGAEPGQQQQAAAEEEHRKKFSKKY